MSVIRFGQGIKTVSILTPTVKKLVPTAPVENQRPENERQLCMELRQHLLTSGIPFESLLQVACVPGTLANEGRYILQVDCDFRVGEDVKKVLLPSNGSEQPLPTFHGWPVRIQYKARNRSEDSGGYAHIL